MCSGRYIGCIDIQRDGDVGVSETLLNVFRVPVGHEELGGVGVAQAFHGNFYAGVFAEGAHAFGEVAGDDRLAVVVGDDEVVVFIAFGAKDNGGLLFLPFFEVADKFGGDFKGPVGVVVLWSAKERLVFGSFDDGLFNAKGILLEVDVFPLETKDFFGAHAAGVGDEDGHAIDAVSDADEFLKFFGSDDGKVFAGFGFFDLFGGIFEDKAIFDGLPHGHPEDGEAVAGGAGGVFEFFHHGFDLDNVELGKLDMADGVFDGIGGKAVAFIGVFFDVAFFVEFEVVVKVGADGHFFGVELFDTVVFG